MAAMTFLTNALNIRTQCEMNYYILLIVKIAPVQSETSHLRKGFEELIFCVCV